MRKTPRGGRPPDARDPEEASREPQTKHDVTTRKRRSSPPPRPRRAAPAIRLRSEVQACPIRALARRRTLLSSRRRRGLPLPSIGDFTLISHNIKSMSEPHRLVLQLSPPSPHSGRPIGSDLLLTADAFAEPRAGLMTCLGSVDASEWVCGPGWGAWDGRGWTTARVPEAFRRDAVEWLRTSGTTIIVTANEPGLHETVLRHRIQ